MTGRMIGRTLLLAVLGAASVAAQGQVTFDRLVRAKQEPQNWLVYSGSYMSQRHSELTQITPENVKNLENAWIFQLNSREPTNTRFEVTPVVVDGIMYMVQPPNDVIALDATNGRMFWTFSYNPSPQSRPCCGRVNRGVAILGDRLFMGTIDGHLIALDTKTGKPLWDVSVVRPESGYALVAAPLVVKDKVIIGPAGGEFGIRGFLAAFDVATGKEVWRFNLIPGPGEFGFDSWAGDAWKTGGGSIWLTGSYDPELNLTYWGVGNPGPDWNGDNREGDNLFSNSVVAIDADTGKRRWHFQFSPHDEFDYDAVQIPVLADANWQGTPRKLMYFANRNGFFYVLDRATGQFLLGKPFVEVNWASGLDPKTGRPIRIAGKAPSAPPGTLISPGNQGGTNWYSPSYSPRTGLFYIPTWANYRSMYVRDKVEYVEGRRFAGGGGRAEVAGIRVNGNSYSKESEGYGAVRAIDPNTGDLKWEFKMSDLTWAGILTTATNVLFSGGNEGYFYALDARNGNLLWKTIVGGSVRSGPMTYSVAGKQYVAACAGSALFVFKLRE